VDILKGGKEMNCNKCKYIKCLKRTDEEFEVCPVEADKRIYEENQKKAAESNKE
jgi:hypothetical protein